VIENKDIITYNNCVMKNIKDYRLIFMGTPHIAAEVFEALIKAGYNFVGLIAQEDKPVGRKGILEAVPTKVIALKYNIPVFQPHKVRLDYEFARELKPDLILTMAYGQIVPQGLLDIPLFGCLNLHGSILPKYRGAAPIQRAIIDGETKTGITLMQMVDKMDAGKMYAIEEVEITGSDNYTSLCEKMAQAAIKVSLDNLPKYLAKKLPGVDQDESLVTIANKIKAENEKLDLTIGCFQFINYVRGLSDEPGAYLLLNENKFKILAAHKISDEVGEVGKLNVAKNLTLQLVDGKVALDMVQLEGKKRMDGKSFANGNKQFDGLILK
jgi:methionyl-tRNA formyltransferase